MPPPLRFGGLEPAEILGRTVPVATTRRSRLLGLALLRRERAGEGLLITGCRSVHTFGMRFPLDLLFLDERWRVIELRREVRPRRIARCSAAAAVLELPSPWRRAGHMLAALGEGDLRLESPLGQSGIDETSGPAHVRAVARGEFSPPTP